jgi:hypothetical protein
MSSSTDKTTALRWNIFNIVFHRAMLGGLVLLVVLACCCCRYNTVRKDALRTQSSSAYWLGMEEEQSCTTPAQQVNNHFNEFGGT